METIKFIESEIDRLQTCYYETSDKLEQAYINGKIYAYHEALVRIKTEVK